MRQGRTAGHQPNRIFERDRTAGLECKHRTLAFTREGGNVVTVLLAPQTVRAADLAIGERDRRAGVPGYGRPLTGWHRCTEPSDSTARIRIDVYIHRTRRRPSTIQPGSQS